MAKEIRLPKFGDTMEEATVVACLVNSGDRVKSGDALFDIETDKATLEMESPADGYVKKILVEAGKNYRVGMPLLILGEKDEQVSDDFVKSLLKAHVPASTAPPAAEMQKAAQAVVPSSEAVSLEGLKPGQRIRITRFQKLTGQKMLRSKQEIPCFYLNVRADVTDMVECRAKLNQIGPAEVSYNDYIIKAVALGLEKFPLMTGRLEDDNIKLAGSIGVGLAIALPEGLVAPIIKNADKKTIVEIARCTRDLADRAKNNKLAPDDLEGGCVTISNLGALGIDSFIPIVIPGQCSILGIGRIKDVCVTDDHNVVVRKIMNMTLSVDHRVVNGAYAAQFLDFVKKVLEDTAHFK